jgi:hypothetical protein
MRVNSSLFSFSTDVVPLEKGAGSPNFPSRFNSEFSEIKTFFYFVNLLVNSSRKESVFEEGDIFPGHSVPLLLPRKERAGLLSYLCGTAFLFPHSISSQKSSLSSPTSHQNFLFTSLLEIKMSHQRDMVSLGGYVEVMPTSLRTKYIIYHELLRREELNK